MNFRRRRFRPPTSTEISMHEEKNTSVDDQTERDDTWLDEALSQSFPASDPIPWNHRDFKASEISDEQSATDSDIRSGT